MSRAFPGIAAAIRAARAAAWLPVVAALTACDTPSELPVPPAVATVEISEPAVTLPVGGDRQLAAVLKAADGSVLTGRTVSWAVGDAAVATISASGRVTAHAAGLTTISASSEGKNGNALLTVTNPLPAIASLSPSVVSAGGTGFILTIAGNGFAPGALVHLDGAVRAPLYLTSTELRVAVPAQDIAAEGTVEVVVINAFPGGGASQPASLVVAAGQPPNPVPVVATLAPASVVAGGPGITLVVLGSGFVPTSVVTWDGQPRPTTYASANELRAEIAAPAVAHPGSVAVRVTSPAPGGGESNTRSFAIAAAQPGNPVPVIDMVSPGAVSWGTPAQMIEIYGSGFVPASVVRVNGVDRPTTYQSSGVLRVTLSAADLATPRFLALSVFNPAPGGGTSNPAQVHVYMCCFDLLYSGPVAGRQELLKIPLSHLWTEPIRMLPGMTVLEASSAPDGRYVAVTAVDDEGGTDIYVVHVATREIQRLTHTGAADQPAWWGQRIAYRRRLDERSSIWVATSLNSYASGPWLHARLSPLGVDDTWPAWSPDGARIGFASTAGGSTDIWVMNADGSGRRRVTSSPAHETEPTWSPDGLMIAYTQLAANGSPTIRVVASGLGWVNINQPLLGEGRLPAWSPDGQSIAFSTATGARVDVGRMRPDGTHRSLLTADFTGGTRPSWSRAPH